MGSKVNISKNDLTIEATDLNLQYKGSKDNNDNLYKRYCTCRDQELDKFWKNSVFVWCFLLLCFGSFGIIMTDYVSTIPKENSKIYIEKEQCVKLLAVISYFGFLISNIWVWMARGLKAWYEVYESAIWDMESKSNVFGFERNYTIENYWGLKKNGYSLFCSDRFSPSKIVILIGHLLRIIWFIAYCSCLFISFDCILPIKTSNNSFWIYIISCISFCSMLFILLSQCRITHWKNFVGNFVGMIIGIVIICCCLDWQIKDNIDIKLEFLCVLMISILFVFVCGQFIKSSTLRTPKENKIFQQIRNMLNSSSDNTKNLYFEVKDNNVKFFFSNKEEKDKYKPLIESLFEKNNKDTNWIKGIWKKIIDWLKSKEDESEKELTFPIDYLKKDIDDTDNNITQNN